MTVNRFFGLPCIFQFLEDFLIPIYDTWKIHHLGKPDNIIHFKQKFDILRINYCTGSFKRSCRYARRCCKIKLKWNFRSAFHHYFNALKPHDVCNFMRIADNRSGTVAHRNLCELCRSEHAAFYMNMSINQPRNHQTIDIQLSFFCYQNWRDLLKDAILYPNSCRIK